MLAYLQDDLTFHALHFRPNFVVSVKLSNSLFIDFYILVLFRACYHNAFSLFCFFPEHDLKHSMMMWRSFTRR
jgi:hypothetical protein